MQEIVANRLLLEQFVQDKVNKRFWLTWLEHVETYCKTQNIFQLKNISAFNHLIFLSCEKIYVRLLWKDEQLDGVVFYDKNTSYRIIKSHNYHLINYSVHQVSQIRGLSPTQIVPVQKPAL